MGKLELVVPGDVVELVDGMKDLYIMGTVDGFQKVTKIDGLQDMSALTVSVGGDGAPAPSLSTCIFLVMPPPISCWLPSRKRPRNVSVASSPPALVVTSAHLVFQEMTLQSCLIAKMEGLEGLTSLTRLTLYDNQILTLNVPPSLSGLTYLDMSYNLVKSTAPLAGCPLLDEVRRWCWAF